MRWSDGEPFTANDIMFYIEDVVLNKELTPNRASADWLPESTGDELQVEMIDDYTVKVHLCRALRRIFAQARHL